MANTYIDPGGNNSAVATIPRAYKMWVMGLLGSSVLLVALGIWLAGNTAGGATRPWVGTGLAAVLALAVIVGASKTSSA